MKSRKKIILGAVILAIAGTFGFFKFNQREQAQIVLETVNPIKGDIQNVVSATGTVQPVDKIAVGTQVSGVLKRVLVDFNTTVKKGQLMAEIDKTNLLAIVAQNKASLLSAQTELDFQKKNYARTRSLFDKQLVSEEVLDKATYDYEKAKSAYDRTDGDVARAQTNLSYATIYSPIDGVVLSRAVDEGQTVAASLNAPTLFTIARDLTKMQVEVDVDEADIGQVKNAQAATFTVDAYPEQSFTGTVAQIRLEPKVSSNVVTYTVIVSADNPDQLLMPGMTATISISTQHAKGVLTLPAKAVRFRPDRELMKEYMAQMGIQSSGVERVSGRSGNRDENSPPRTRKSPEESKGTARVWIKSATGIKPAKIKTGVTDGTLIEILEGISTDDTVVVSLSRETAAKKADKKAAPSPFMPNRRR